MTDRLPTAPRDLKTAGKAMWRTFTKALEFRVDEMHLLGQACRVEDRLAGLRKGGDLDPKALCEERLQVELQRKLLGSMTWPEDGTADLSRWGRTMAHRRWHRA